MTLQELEQYMQNKLFPELQETVERSLFDRIQKEVNDQFEKIANSQKKKNVGHNPYYKNPNGVSKEMDDYVNETYGATSVQNKTFKGMFGDKSLSAGGFDSFGEFLKTVADGRVDPRLVKAASEANENIPSSGGFLVPSEYEARLVDQSLESEIVRPRAQTYGMTSKTKLIPGVQISSHASSLFGGIVAYWTDEGDTTIKTKPTFRMMQLTAKKLMMLVEASNELIADSVPSYDQVLGGMLTKALGWYLDDAYINGTGAGQPQGILHCPSVIEVQPENEQPTDTVVYENCVNMFSKLHPQCYSNAIWIANLTLLPQLSTLFYSVGTGGIPVQLLQQSNGKFSLLGRELVFTEKNPVLGERADLVLVDLSQYACGIREGLKLEKSSHVGFETDSSMYRLTARADGMGLWDQALTLKDGSTQVSWCVVLAAR
jgi:HK97 family phage major capsid protein